ncbi:MAG: YlbF family regulator [Syntrophomonas sp.]|nr:YlbF family regulator [Syntrophomonas sp.]
MTTDEIIKMAFELGNAISQSAEVDDLKAMQIRLGEDQEASGLIMRYQEARVKADNKLQDGLLITSTEENHLEILQQQLNSNPMVKELIQVQEKFNNLMQGVYFALNQAISGEDCSSDCSTCGGSCGM